MDNIKVSIIMPVYNGADNLRAHLGNVLGQTLQEIEIILVNDASSDDTLKVMNDAKTQFPDKVKVINSPVNGGAGGARNLGLEVATGEYVGFVDCDDVIETSMYEKLYQAAKAYKGEAAVSQSDVGSGEECDVRKTGADMVDCGYYYQMNDNAIIHTADDMTGEIDATKRKKHIVAGGYIVSKIFRREFLVGVFKKKDRLVEKKGRIEYFRKNCILEDADFLGIIYATMKSCVNVKEVLYYYLDAVDSSSKTTNPEKYLLNIENAIEAIYDRCSVLPSYDEIKDAFEYEMLAMYSNGLVMVLADYVNKSKEASGSMTSDEIDSDTKKKIRELLALKAKVISGGFDNSYVKEKIGPQDIEIMKMADRDADALLEWARENS